MSKSKGPPLCLILKLYAYLRKRGRNVSGFHRCALGISSNHLGKAYSIPTISSIMTVAQRSFTFSEEQRACWILPQAIVRRPGSGNTGKILDSSRVTCLHEDSNSPLILGPRDTTEFHSSSTKVGGSRSGNRVTLFRRVVEKWSSPSLTKAANGLSLAGSKE